MRILSLENIDINHLFSLSNDVDVVRCFVIISVMIALITSLTILEALTFRLTSTLTDLVADATLVLCTF